MPYNAQAESYAAGRTPSAKPWPYSTPAGWCRFDDVYSDIADSTPTAGEFQASALVGKLRSIAHLAPKTQGQILAVVVRDMQSLPAEADGLRRVRHGWYEWRLSAEHAEAEAA